MITVTRRLEWDAMHRIPLHESKCKAFHGHRYVAEITCTAEGLDQLGRVIDFGVIKGIVGRWIDERWDHTAILMRNDPDPAVPVLAASNEVWQQPASTPPPATAARVRARRCLCTATGARCGRRPGSQSDSATLPLSGSSAGRNA